MKTPVQRLLDAWLETDVALGRFLSNACTLAGKGLRFMTEEELADAAEAYTKWRKDVGWDKKGQGVAL